MNPYDVLNVRRNASNAEIKLSFNKMMNKYDLKNYVGDPHFAQKRMKDIVEAYNILSNPQKRQEYDKEHQDHTSLHKTTSDSFNNYYNRPKTNEHTHNDYEIAQEKYNAFKKHIIDESLDDPTPFEEFLDSIPEKLSDSNVDNDSEVNPTSNNENAKALSNTIEMIVFFFVIFYAIKFFIALSGMVSLIAEELF